MPNLLPRPLQHAISELFIAAGASEEEGKILSSHLVESSLLGHDSHGVINAVRYVHQIRSGMRQSATDPTLITDMIMMPQAELTLIKERGAFASYDGHMGIGPVLGMKAMEKAMELARTHGIGCVTMRHCAHLGYLGAYPSMAANREMIGLAVANWSGPEGALIPPFGGIEGRLPPDPMAFAAPTDREFIFLMDFATSGISYGKLALYHRQGKSIPEGLALDANGKDITDPGKFFASPGGSILPLGGKVAGYKGVALIMMIEILAGALSGHKTMKRDVSQGGRQGFFALVVDIAQFISLEEFKSQVGELLDYVKDTPTLPGFEDILVSGEHAYREKLIRQKHGISIEDNRWQEILELGRQLNLELEALVEVAE
ncbi:Ldh family oxidoreductase [Candidatus Bipolaricaulota bacterium]